MVDDSGGASLMPVSPVVAVSVAGPVVVVDWLVVLPTPPRLVEYRIRGLYVLSSFSWAEWASLDDGESGSLLVDEGEGGRPRVALGMV